ncbi:hypothetical protein ACHAWF_006450 [Thalassiosira exigua]
MSAFLVGRRLNALTFARGKISSWLSPATTPTTPRISAAAHRPLDPAPPAAPSSSPFASRRTFSAAIGEEGAVGGDDDGGPVRGPASSASSGAPSFEGMTDDQLADMRTVPGWGLIHSPPRRNPRGALVGTVVSDKMQKTVNVAVDRFKMIPKYKKRWRFTRKFMAHDEHEVCNVGDLVMIVPCQKVSRHKHFMVREIIRPKGQL